MMTRLFSGRRSFGKQVVVALFFVLLPLVSCTKSCKKAASPSVTADLDYLPQETLAILSVDVRKVRQSHLGAKIKEVLNQDTDFAKTYVDFASKCHMDPDKVDSLLFAIPQGYDRREPGDFLAIERGSFTESEMLSCLDAYKIERKSSNDKGYTIHDLTVRTASSSVAISMVFPTGKDFALVGKRARLQAALDLQEKKLPSARANPSLMKAIDRASAGDAAIWGVFFLSEDQIAKTKGTLHRVATLDVSIKAVIISLLSKENLELKMQFDASSADEAQKTAVAIGQKVEEAKKLPQIQMLGLTSLLGLIKVSTNNEAVLVDVALNQSQVDDMIGRVAGLKNSI